MVIAQIGGSQPKDSGWDHRLDWFQSLRFCLDQSKPSWYHEEEEPKENWIYFTSWELCFMGNLYLEMEIIQGTFEKGRKKNRNYDSPSILCLCAWLADSEIVSPTILS